MRKSLLLLMLVMVLGACSHNVRDEFDESLKQYNDLFRWNELETTSVFVADPLRADYIVRAKAAKNIRVVDFRVIGSRYDEKRNKASVEVQVDYYLLSSATVKSLRDTQEWSYQGEKGARRWRLVSQLPEFR
jgi:hypothetical protein